MSKDGKHHYIPVFYLKRWVGSDGKLCEYSRPYDTVRPRRVHPDATGYVHGLYTIPGLPPESEQAQYVEKKFLQKVDDWAARAIVALSNNEVTSSHLCVAWSIFLYSLMLRTPEHLLSIAGKLADTHKHLVSLTDADALNLLPPPNIISAAEVLPEIANSQLVIRGLLSMQWTVRTLNRSTHTLLTSDRPIVMTNGLAKPNDQLLIPISPTQLFILTNSNEVQRLINRWDESDLVRIVNDRVAGQAIKYVYGTNDRQLRFVSNRLGRRFPATPLG